MEGTTFFFEWEPVLMEWLQGGMGSALTFVMSFITLFGEEVVAVGILAFLYWVWDKEAAIFAGTNVLAGTVLNPVLKNFALRRRPYFDHPSIRCLKPVHEGDIYDIAAQGYSFPSGHSSNSVILFGSLALVRKVVPQIMSLRKERGKNEPSPQAGHFLYVMPKLWTAIAVFTPLLVGCSRVLLGVHYPTDVLFGWASGVVVMLAVSQAQRRIKKQEYLYLFLAIVFLPGFFFCKTNDFYTCYGILTGFSAAHFLDERYIRFEGTRNVRAAVLRLAIGLALFGGLNVLCKLPFSDDFLQSATTGQFLFRAARYFLISFLMLGVYPAAFRKVKVLS